MGWACSTYGGEFYTGFWLGNMAAKKPRGTARRGLQDNIKMDHKEMQCGDMVWIDLVQDRDRCRANVDALMNLRVS